MEILGNSEKKKLGEKIEWISYGLLRLFLQHKVPAHDCAHYFVGRTTWLWSGGKLFSKVFQNFSIARNVKAQCKDPSDSWIQIKAPVWGFYSRRWRSATHRHHWILKLPAFIVRIQMPNFTVNKQIKMKPLKVGSRHISKRSLLLQLLFLSHCSSRFINFKAYCLPFLLQVSLLLSFRLKY